MAVAMIVLRTTSSPPLNSSINSSSIVASLGEMTNASPVGSAFGGSDSSDCCDGDGEPMSDCIVRVDEVDEVDN